ncbi:MAG: glycosyltransferase family 39 protein [Nanoarchaeota archaeon]|nr:glycosyltransferase family 39 protein [Nanoarchaeota archaeon]
MKHSKYAYWLLAIFLLTLAIRLIISFSIPHFTYDSYFHLRQIEHISQTGLPLYNDPLSYGGRQHIFLPIFHYVIAFFNLFIPLEIAAKIIPNVLFALLTILIYLIAKKTTNDEPAALLSALIAGFLPILFTPNSLHPAALFFPLVFLNIYAFLRITEKKYLYLCLASFITLCSTSSAASLLIIGYGVYGVLSFIELKPLPKIEKEVVIFSLFFFVWSQFIFFKNTLLSQGIRFIWRNVPPQIISTYFPEISIPKAIVAVGIIPFVVGIIITYRSLFQLRDRKLLFLLSLVISTIVLTWLKLMEFEFSLAFFGLILAIFFASFYAQSSGYLHKTTLKFLKKNYGAIIIFLLAFSTIWPAINMALHQPIPTVEEVTAFSWMKDNLPANSTIAALMEEGHLITYYGQHKNMMDNQFALAKDAGNRFADLQFLYTTPFQTQAFEIMDKYGVDYLVLTPQAQEKYDFAGLKYYSPHCFKRVYGAQTRIYRVKCSLQEAS